MPARLRKTGLPSRSSSNLPLWPCRSADRESTAACFPGCRRSRTCSGPSRPDAIEGACTGSRCLLFDVLQAPVLLNEAQAGGLVGRGVVNVVLLRPR